MARVAASGELTRGAVAAEWAHGGLRAGHRQSSGQRHLTRGTAASPGAQLNPNGTGTHSTAGQPPFLLHVSMLPFPPQKKWLAVTVFGCAECCTRLVGLPVCSTDVQLVMTWVCWSSSCKFDLQTAGEALMVRELCEVFCECDSGAGRGTSGEWAKGLSNFASLEDFSDAPTPNPTPDSADGDSDSAWAASGYHMSTQPEMCAPSCSQLSCVPQQNLFPALHVTLFSQNVRHSPVEFRNRCCLVIGPCRG